MDKTVGEPSMPVYDPKAAEHMTERRIAFAEQDADVVAAFYKQLLFNDMRINHEAAALITAAWLRRTL